MSVTNKIFDARNLLLDARHELTSLSKAFRVVGNPNVADRLEEIANEIGVAEEMVWDAWSEELSGSLKQAQANVSGILSTLLSRPEESKP